MRYPQLSARSGVTFATARNPSGCPRAAWRQPSAGGAAGGRGGHGPRYRSRTPLELGEERLLLEKGMRTLARRERRIVQLRYFGGFSQRRIAAELGLSQVHVSRLLRQSLGKLRAEIGQT